MKSVMVALFTLVIAGCANSFEKVRTAANEAPDWYDAARTEIIGEGYPNLGSTPQLQAVDVQTASNSLSLSRSEVVAAQRMFASHPRSIEPITTDIEMRALKAQLIAKLGASGPVPTGTDADLFLTAADVARINELFRRAEER